MVGKWKGTLKYSWPVFTALHGKCSWNGVCLGYGQGGLFACLGFIYKVCSLVSNRPPRTHLMSWVNSEAKYLVQGLCLWKRQYLEHGILHFLPVSQLPGLELWFLSPMVLNCLILTLKNIALWLHKHSCTCKDLLAVKWAGNVNTLVCQNSK